MDSSAAWRDAALLDARQDRTDLPFGGRLWTGFGSDGGRRIRRSSSADKNFYYTPHFAPDLKDIRVGCAPVDFDECADPAARADYAKALETIRSLGVQLIETKLPDFLMAP